MPRSRNGATCRPSRVQVVVAFIAAVALASFGGLFVAHQRPARRDKTAALQRREVVATAPAVPAVVVVVYSGPIYFDFYESSARFAYANYKSVESLLQTYPQASVEALIVGPRQVDYYQVADNLSKHTFLLYKKRGYRIAAVAQHEKSLQLGVNATTVPGRAYFARAFARCCAVARAVDMRAVTRAPLPLLWYVRLLRLHRRGGLVADASWLHLRPLPLRDGGFDVDGWAVRAGCSSGPNSTAACGVSTLLVFRRGSPVPGCVLQRFDDPAFLACVDDGDGIEEEKKKEGGQKEGHALGQRRANRDDDEPAEAGLHRFARDRRHVRCFEDALARCADQHGVVNALADATAAASAAAAALVADAPPSLSTGVEAGPAAVWLGPRAWAGDWRYLSPADDVDVAPSWSSSSSSSSSSSAALAALVARVRLERNDLEAFNLARCPRVNGNGNGNGSTSNLEPPLCSPYHVYPSPSPRAASHAAQARLSCAPAFLLAGFMKAGTTSLYGSLTNHPQVLRNLQGVGFKESGAYMPPRRETAARMRAFPYVPPNADGRMPFVYGDATVYSSGQMGTPHSMLRDNPRMKAVFAVRDPVQRLVSHHRFVRRYAVQDVNTLVTRTLDGNGSAAALTRLRTLVVTALAAPVDSSTRRAALDDAVEMYYRGLRARGTAGAGMHTGVGSLITWSLYALPVHHFVAVLGRPNVLVVQSERLMLATNHGHGRPEANMTVTAADVDAQFRRLYAFLGLCPPATTKRGFDYKSKDTVDAAHRLNTSTEARLRVFFEPFNRLLDEVVGDQFDY